MSVPTTPPAPRIALDVDGEPPVGRSERLLSWVLSAFILLALSWGYVNIDDGLRDARESTHATLEVPVARARQAHLTQAQSLGLTGRVSENAVYYAEQRATQRGELRDVTRERYRTALDAGKPAATLEAAYRRADRRATAEAASLRARRLDRAVALTELRRFDRGRAPAVRAAQARLDAHEAATGRLIFLGRALLAFGTLALSLLLLRRATRRAPRSLPLVHAAVGAAALLTLALIVDYSEVNLEFASVGPLGLSLLGASLTIAAFVALQRYLRSQRPLRRLRAHECAACGYPAGSSAFCEGCGRSVLEPCTACAEPRRVGAAHCGACGAGAEPSRA